MLYYTNINTNTNTNTNPYTNTNTILYCIILNRCRTIGRDVHLHHGDHWRVKVEKEKSPMHVVRLNVSLWKMLFLAVWTHGGLQQGYEFVLWSAEQCSAEHVVLGWTYLTMFHNI